MSLVKPMWIQSSVRGLAARRGTSLSLVIYALVVSVGLLGPATAAAADYPGFWKVGNQVYAPCAFHPYTSYTDPSTGLERYMRYDFATMRPNPARAGQFAYFGGPNHTEQWYGADGKMYPIIPGGPPLIGFYPGPPPEANLCSQYLAKNPGRPCPTDTNLYKAYLLSNTIWVGGYLAFKPRIDAECAGAPPPTPTPKPCFGKRGGCI